MSKLKIKKLDLLIAIYISALMMAEIMGGKVFQVTDSIQFLGNPIGTSVAVFLIPLIFSINDVIVEVHGKERMLSVARSGLITIVLLLVFTTIATILPAADRSPIPGDLYSEVFSVSQRVAIASLAAFAVSIFTDVAIFSKVRHKLKKYGLWFRNNISNLFAQFIDTVVFLYIAYFSFGTPNHSFLWSIIIPYWLYKSFMSVLVTPLVYLGVKWLKSDK